MTTFKVYHAVKIMSTSFFNFLNIYSTFQEDYQTYETRLDNVIHSISRNSTRQALISNLYDYSIICYLCMTCLKQQQVISYQSSPHWSSLFSKNKSTPIMRMLSPGLNGVALLPSSPPVGRQLA